MVKSHKHVITTSIILIFFISLLVASIPTNVAKPIDKFFSYSVIEIDYDENAASESLLPIDMTKEINVTLNYHVDGYFDEIIPPDYEHYGNFIYVFIENTPEWCAATISPNFLILPGTAGGVSENLSLTLKIDDSAHALDFGKIGFRIEVMNTGPVKGGVFYHNITLNPGYLPLLKINTPNENVKRIGPLESTKFEIEVENLGNGKTLLIAEVINAPKGWIISIDEETVIGAATLDGDNPKKTISLTVQPPIDFGYHDEREIINLSLTPSFFNNPSIKGQSYSVSFLVQSKGVSTPGFEGIYLIFSFIIFILLMRRGKIPNKKSYSTKSRRNHL